MVAVLANSVWQWRKASGFGWSGLNVQIAAEFSDSGRQQRTRILIETVEPRSPGTAAGLRKGDGITELNGFDQNLGKRFRDLRAGEEDRQSTER